MKQYIKICIPYIIAIIMLCIGSFYDYTITDALYGKLPWISNIFERFLLVPIISVSIVTFLVLYILYKKWYFMGISNIIALYIMVDIFHYIKDDFTVNIIIVMVVLASICTYGILFLLRKIDVEIIKKWLPHLLFFTVVFFTSTCIVTLLKMGWGRIRYRQLTSFIEFTPWYSPQGFNGYHSFPSGHTAAFTTILCLLELDEVKNGKKSIWLKILIWIGVIFMPLTRMMCGAHFLSDTAGGFLITYTCYLIYRNEFRKRGIL